MNRQTYLTILGDALSRLVPERERADSLRYYEEYFDEAGPEREAEVIRELGDPEELARKIAREGGYLNDLAEPRRRRVPMWLMAGAVALVIVAGLGIQFVLQRNQLGSRGDGPAVATGNVVQEDTDWGIGVSAVPGGGEMEFHSVSVEAGLANVTISVGGSFDVALDWNADQNYSLSYEIVNGELKVRSKGNGKVGNRDVSAEVIITVPDTTILREVDVEVGLGDIVMAAVWADEVSLETGLGDINLEELQASKELDAVTGMGDVTLMVCPLAEQTELESGMGDVWVSTTCEAANCAYDLSSGMGTVTVDGQDRSRSASKRDGRYKLEASTGMGDVWVEFEA